MKQKSINIFVSSKLFFGLAFSLALFGCSSQASNPSASEIVSANNVAPTNQPSSNKDTTAIPKAELTQAYSQAIGDYIRLVNKEYNLSFDTLFFGKHVFGQPDDFPDIELPATIENTNIRLISPEQGQRKQKENESSYYINLIGWVTADNAAFVFVTFSNGMAHQFDGFIDYKNDIGKKGFEIVNSRFQNYLYKEK